MIFITDYFKFNQKLVRKTYPLPRIGETMQHLEGYHHATSLDLNMGYYTIRISYDSQDIMTIVTEFWKFRYNRLPMGMCALGYILQSKVDKIIGDNKIVKAYIYDIIV